MKKTNNTLYRKRDNQLFGGVCAGIHSYFDLDLDISLFRMLFVIACFGSLGTGLLLYLIAWFIIPIEPTNN